MSFICAAPINYPQSKNDAFIINEKNLLLKEEEKKSILKKCFENLNENGVVIYIGSKQNLEEYSAEEIYDSVYLMKK